MISFIENIENMGRSDLYVLEEDSEVKRISNLDFNTRYIYLTKSLRQKSNKILLNHSMRLSICLGKVQLFSMRNLQKSMEYVNEVYTVYNSKNCDKINIENIICLLEAKFLHAWILNIEKKLRDSKNIYQEMLDLSKKKNLLFWIGVSYNGIGACYDSLKYYNKADQYYQMAIEFFSRIDDFSYQARVYKNLAYVNLKLFHPVISLDNMFHYIRMVSLADLRDDYELIVMMDYLQDLADLILNLDLGIYFDVAIDSLYHEYARNGISTEKGEILEMIRYKVNDLKS